MLLLVGCIVGQPAFNPVRIRAFLKWVGFSSTHFKKNEIFSIQPDSNMWWDGL